MSSNVLYYVVVEVYFSTNNLSCVGDNDLSFMHIIYNRNIEIIFSWKVFEGDEDYDSYNKFELSKELYKYIFHCHLQINIDQCLYKYLLKYKINFSLVVIFSFV